MSRLAEGSAALLVRNTLAGGIGSFASVLAPILLTPVMIDRLGPEAFGIWILATSLTLSAGYLSLADLGVQQAAVRFIADARREGDAVRVNEVYSTTFALFCVIAAILTPLLVFSASWFVGLFGAHSGIADDSTIAFQLVAASLLFDLPSMAMRAILEGAQRLVAIRTIDIARVVVTAGLSLLVLLFGYGLVALALVTLLVACCAFAVTALTAGRVVPESQMSHRAVRRAHLRQLFNFGGAFFSLRIVSVIYRQMDRVIIAVVLGVSFVTTYEIANKIQAAAGVVFAITSSALLPAAAFIRADSKRLRELFLRGTSYTIALTVPVTLGAILFANPLVTGWVGSEWESAVGITRLFLVWMIFNAATSIGWAILVAQGRLRPIVILNVAWVVLNFALSLWLVFPLGVAGVIWGTVISSAALTVAYTRLYLQELNVSFIEWVRRVLMPNIPGVCAQVVVALPFLLFPGLAPGLLGALAAGALCSAASIAAYIYVGLHSAERRQLLVTLGRASGIARGNA